MDHLWSPWRYQYVSGGERREGCLFCIVAAANRDAEDFVIHRASLNFVMLNRFPYTAGHLMIAPYAHVDTLEGATEETAAEMMMLTRQAAKRLRRIYRPDGMNIGMNIGASAGAGVAGHIHMHVLPRWTGDANFMSTVGETRVLPEELNETYAKLSSAFSRR